MREGVSSRVVSSIHMPDVSFELIKVTHLAWPIPVKTGAKSIGERLIVCEEMELKSVATNLR